MSSVLRALGYRIGNQADAELLLEDWAVRDFRRIVAHCKSADAFQDIPFSLSYTFQVLDHEFPNSKFILTVRESAEQWYDSLTRFHARIVCKGNTLPTVEDLKNFPYRSKGYLWQAARLIYGVDEQAPYDRARYIAQYVKHNENVREYFRHRRSSLLELNLAHVDAADRLAQFLEVDRAEVRIPHLNRSDWPAPQSWFDHNQTER